MGYKDFTLKNADITGIYTPGGSLTAVPFADRMSIGMYNMDIHSIDGCVYEPYP